MSNKEQIREYLGEFGVRDYSSDKKAILSINSAQAANSTVDLTWPASTGTIAPVASIPSGWEEVTGLGTVSFNSAAYGTFTEVRLWKFGPLRKLQIKGTLIPDNTAEALSDQGFLLAHAPQQVVRRPVVSQAATLMAKIDTDGYLHFTDVGAAATITIAGYIFFVSQRAYAELMWSTAQ